MPAANQNLAFEAMRREAETPQLATPADYDAVAADLAEAFVADPVLDWLLRDDAARATARRMFFRFIVSIYAAQKPTILRPAGGGAAAIWVRSEDMMSAAKPGLLDELRSTFVFIRACGLKRVSRANEVRAAMDANHPMDRPHDYLSFLGVRPEAQGHGIGSRLLKAYTPRLDAEGRAAYLETGTPRTLSLYQSHGFAITGEWKAGRDGPTMWSLWREPQV